MLPAEGRNDLSVPHFGRKKPSPALPGDGFYVLGAEKMEQNTQLDHLKMLEAESIYILREAAAEFSRPVMLYSIGKDSVGKQGCRIGFAICIRPVCGRENRGRRCGSGGRC